MFYAHTQVVTFYALSPFKQVASFLVCFWDVSVLLRQARANLLSVTKLNKWASSLHLCVEAWQEIWQGWTKPTHTVSGTAIAVLTVVILIVKFCINEFAIVGKAWTPDSTTRYIETFVKYFIIGVTVLVVAVPEGLPLAVTLALAYSVKVCCLSWRLLLQLRRSTCSMVTFYILNCFLLHMHQ